ncbi:hypothetical protein NX059_008987 [Plenodomus lindquistii]|nr:hypothetical protein NX059_008987 [Plenodomus lindquistii]
MFLRRGSDVPQDDALQHQEHHTMLSSKLLRQKARQLGSRGSVICQRPACRPLTRAFHASPARQGAGLDTLLYVPHEMMNLIHANVPWYAAIPLSAFIVRGLLVTTAGAYSRSLMARYIGLHPLRQALGAQKRDEVLRKGNFRSPQEASVRVKAEVRQVVKALDKEWNVPFLMTTVWWSLVQLPVFLAMAETVRQKCGARDGLLGLATSLFHSTRDGLVRLKDSLFGTTDAASGNGPSAVGSTFEVDNPDTDLANHVNSLASNPTSDAGEPFTASTFNLGEMAGNQSQWFDISLATEGALWFPDLILPDPTGVLPFVVSGLMFCNIYFTKSNAPSGANWQNASKRTLLAVSLLVGPVCQDLPAALMLYWASSTSSVIVWNWYLDWRYPTPHGFSACRRPLLMPLAPTQRPEGRRA